MRNWIALGSLFAFLGVAAGAFGTHALKPRLDPELVAAFETGARYQLVHALALVLVGLAAGRLAARPLAVAGAAFTAGIVLFSGSLYVLALTGVHAWGAVTPFGGVGFLTGWCAFLLAAVRARR